MRIRSLKPEFFRDELTGLMDPASALFYLGLACHADDEGRFEWIPALIRADLDPFDAKWGGSKGVENQLARLLEAERVVQYEANGRTYGWIPTQTKHQHPNRPSKSRFPPPPCGLTATAVIEQCKDTAGVGEEKDREKDQERERAHAMRGARVGVGSPAFEAVTHWTSTVWPRLSPTVCAPVTAPQVQSLSGLAQRYGSVEVLGAMDRAAADPFWADKLDLDTFVAKFTRFVSRNAPPKHSTQNPQTGVAAPADASAFGEGGQRAIE